MPYRRWTQAQKLEAVSLGKTIGAEAAASQLGMSKDSVREWMAQAGVEPELSVDRATWRGLLDLALARTQAHVASGRLSPTQMATIAGIAARNAGRDEPEPQPEAPDARAGLEDFEALVAEIRPDLVDMGAYRLLDLALHDDPMPTDEEHEAWLLATRDAILAHRRGEPFRRVPPLRMYEEPAPSSEPVDLDAVLTLFIEWLRTFDREAWQRKRDEYDAALERRRLRARSMWAELFSGSPATAPITYQQTQSPDDIAALLAEADAWLEEHHARTSQVPTGRPVEPR